jgi:hypothetical protein
VPCGPRTTRSSASDLAESTSEGRIKGKAMVVGATGAIGSVCARLLALASDELWLVSPESAKLLALKHDIERGTRGRRSTSRPRPTSHLPDMDLIVTATSGAGKRVLDIMAGQAGLRDHRRRAPAGPVGRGRGQASRRARHRVRRDRAARRRAHADIGLPPGVAYACLAETVVLALEGRYETFTVGRNIEWEKVKEIYKLGLKHGMKLATISGVNGVYTDEDIARIRELALGRLGGR